MGCGSPGIALNYLGWEMYCSIHLVLLFDWTFLDCILWPLWSHCNDDLWMLEKTLLSTFDDGLMAILGLKIGVTSCLVVLDLMCHRLRCDVW